MEQTEQVNTYLHFDADLIEKASSLKDADKEKKDTFRKELQELFKKKDLESKTAIKANLIKIEEDHKKALQEFKDLKENSLKKAEEDYLKIQAPTKKDQRDYSDIRKGIEINCKRSTRKENSSYESLVTNTKLLRKEIHDEYLKILSLAGMKESPVDRLKNKQLEYYGTVNLKASLLSKKFLINKIPLLMLLLIILAYYIGKTITGYSGNLGDVINNGIFVAVVATGAVFIYSQGGFDMSLGNASLMCATIAALLYNNTHNLFVSLLIAVLLGAFLGIVNAVLATMLNLPVMVMTLTMMNILAAISDAIFSSNGGLISVDEGMIDNAWVYASFLALFFILCWFIFNYTKVGRRNKFIGSNKKAAKFNGIDLMKAGLISFAISGIGLGICGFLFACTKSGSKFGSATVLSQVGLNVVIAIVFGGMTTSGGPKSKVSCAIIGAFFSVFLDEFFAAISTPAFQVGDYCYLAKGIIFLIVSLANMWDTRGKMLASGGTIQ